MDSFIHRYHGAELVFRSLLVWSGTVDEDALNLKASDEGKIRKIILMIAVKEEEDNKVTPWPDPERTLVPQAIRT